MNCTVDIVERLRSSQTAYGWINRQNEEAAKEIERLRTALSTEAQPEVTGAVAEIVEVQVDHDDYSLEVKLLQPLPHGTKLYPPSAIQAAVREKLEEAADMVAERKTINWLEAAALAKDIRALMESPHTSVEEPAN